MKAVYDAHPEEWESWYVEMIDDAHARVAKYKQQGTKHFYAYGVSMGTLIANKFTRETAEVTCVILNLTYGDLASTIFTWWGIRKAKNALVRNGYDLRRTQVLASYADPITNAEGLQGKKILLFLARKDKVLLWKYTQHTLQAFRKANLDMEYIENKYLGHFLAGSKNMVNLNRLDRFYQNK